MSKAVPTNRFEISAAVVFRLGEELITDVVQALVELVKNSYDADASWVRVSITRPDPNALPKSSERMGEISVEDDGHGMDDDAFRRGWLMIAGSAKKKLKDSGGVTRKTARTPVGDKGLGRLGVQRLGYEVEILSRPSENTSEEFLLAFSWRDFERAEKLSDVPVQLTSRERSRKRSGTKITVRDLKDPEQWRGEQARNRLQHGISELISPFREVGGFSVSVHLDGEEIPVAELAEGIRHSATVQYKLDFDRSRLRVGGRARLDFVMRAQKREDQEFLTEILNRDKGRAFFKFLQTRKAAPTVLTLEKSPWFVSFNFEQDLEDFPDLRMIDKQVADPGPFRGEVDYILLDHSDIEKSNVWSSLGEYRKFVSEFAGVRVYRDGFGVRLGEDWLNLGQQQTSGASMYGLRPKNVIGFIAITARDNRVLHETTSREGFQKTPHYENFYRLLQRFVIWSSQVQEFLRRGALDFLHATRADKAGLEPGREIASATDTLKKQADAVDSEKRDLSEARTSLRELAASAKTQAAKLVENDEQFSLYHREKIGQLNNLLKHIGEVSGRVQQLLDRRESDAKTVNQTRELLDAVLEREKRLRQELEMFYEGIALGLTAEALSHEIAAIAERLAKKGSQTLRYLSEQSSKDVKVLSFVEHVKASVSALRKQLSHLDPSLRFIRDKRESINLSSEISVTRDFFKDRFKANGITMLITLVEDVTIVINKGKLSQIFDNILLNSEYWLRESRRKDGNFKGLITVEIHNPFVRFWDNGPGVSRTVEENLFDPFITTKGQGQGRGLGLFIVQQLLDSEGCSARLMPERNAAKRRFKFEVDFTGAIHE
jgi:signal transduction histidine kinase